MYIQKDFDLYEYSKILLHACSTHIHKILQPLPLTINYLSRLMMAFAYSCVFALPPRSPVNVCIHC